MNSFISEFFLCIVQPTSYKIKSYKNEERKFLKYSV